MSLLLALGCLSGVATVALAAALLFARRNLAECQRARQEFERSARVMEEERQVLELIARGATLKIVLEALTAAVERIVPGVACSVLLVDRDRKCLTQGAAPHLPAEFWKMCDGIPIGDYGCCPSAALHNETMISEDLAEDPKWLSIRDTVVRLGLRSCWSVPIQDSDTHEVIGTFAIYRTVPAKPAREDLVLVQASARLAGNAIERLRAAQQARDFAKRFSLAERAAEFGIWEWDPRTGLFDLSAGTARTIGYEGSTRDVTLDQLYRTVHPDDVEPARLAREEAFRKGGPYEHEFRRVSAVDGSIRWYRNRGQVELRDGEPVKVIGAIIDITAHKEMTQNLERAKSVAEEAVRAKSEFMANMSHEIRTPMNAVIGMTSLLEEFNLPGEAASYVQTIRVSGEALLGVINDILDFSKIEAGKMDLDRLPFSLRSCLEEASEILATKASEKGLELVVDVDPQASDWIYGDPNRLRQILVNLIGNAVKFTEAGEVVVRAANSSAAGGGEMLIQIRDTGIGIPLDKQDRLFRSFSQVDSSTTSRFGGTGLGLSISKGLAGMMGGRIRVESTVGVGSTFSLVIPAEPAPPLEQPPVAEPDWAGKRVLVVDDNPVNRQIVTAFLAHWNFAVDAVAGAQAALNRLRGGERWDLLVLDWHMPKMTGVELARIIKDEQGPAAPPMLMLSSSAASVRSAFGDGENPLAAHMLKPIRRNQLHKVISRVLAGIPEAGGTERKGPGPRLADRMPLHILVADDNPVNQTVAGRLLERWGYEPVMVSNGVEVLEALRLSSYDLVLLDIHMPVMGGIEAARRVRADLPAEHQPHIVALSAAVFCEDRESCLAAGMDGFLAKPIDLGELQRTLEESFRRANVAVLPT